MEEKNESKHIMNDKITKSFSIDIQTLSMIKDFKEKYQCDSLNYAIEELVNVGLANFGYKTEKEIKRRMKDSGVFPETIRVPKPELSSDEIALSISLSKSQKEHMGQRGTTVKLELFVQCIKW